MDRVRLGRALGYGTRHAAKTLAAVAEAAAAAPAPAPAGSRPQAQPAASQPAASPRATRTTRPAQRTPSRQHARAAGRSLWKPLATFSSALWLRVTGLFFAVIALALLNGAWHQRAAWHATPAGDTASRFWVFLGFGLLFAYFALSGFLRAARRERRG